MIANFSERDYFSITTPFEFSSCRSMRWSKIGIITDNIVGELHGEWAKSLFEPFSESVELFSVPHGEKSKSRCQVDSLQDRLLEKAFDRDALIVGLGGGVICDLAGFVAATFLRGIDLIFVPTTLLAMVDASIGGKCGINTPHGKNLIGSIYFPKEIILDTNFLKTLPSEELKVGMMEIIKVALISDKDFFEEIARNAPLEKLIERAARIKMGIVIRDLYEKGERRSLNFGHTVAHAIEKLSDYTISHGRAVWFGILIEAAISSFRGLLSPKEYLSIQEVLQSETYLFSQEWNYSADEIYGAMKRDKKNKDEKVRMVLLEKIGKVADFSGEYCSKVSIDELRSALSRWV